MQLAYSKPAKSSNTKAVLKKGLLAPFFWRFRASRASLELEYRYPVGYHLAMTDKTPNPQVARYTQKVAELLKYTREKSGLSARELARRVGSSHSTILAYEAGKKVPVTTTLMRLIHACGYSLDFQLSPRIRGDAKYPRGTELQEVLELADAFPHNPGKTPDAVLKP